MGRNEIKKINELVQVVNHQQELIHQLYKFITRMEAGRLFRRTQINTDDMLALYKGVQAIALLDHPPHIVGDHERQDTRHG